MWRKTVQFYWLKSVYFILPFTHVAGTQWGNKKYMNMKHLEAICEDASAAG